MSEKSSLQPAKPRVWKEIIKPENNLFALDFKELWNYRDLLFILIRRDILAIYKQTILGPIWFIIQPALTTVAYMIVFSRIAKLSTGDLPPAIFYLSGLVLWSYFSECILRTSSFFKDNSQILSKVYFPRLIIPLSLVLTNLIKFFIQLLLFFIVFSYYLLHHAVKAPNSYAVITPLLIGLIALLGLGSGILISSVTTKYKDLSHLLAFGIQLLMFTTPVIFPLSSLQPSLFKTIVLANPMTGIIECFRYGFLGKGEFNWQLLGYDALIVLLITIVGIVLFNKVEKDFVDHI